MNRHNISAGVQRFLRLQGLCGGIIVASWLIFWAVQIPIGNVPDLFMYVLTQVNLTVVLLHPLKFLYENRRVRYHWPLHIMAILAVNCAVVVASAGAIYGVDALKLPFIDFLYQSWKFPFVANLVFAFAYEGYKVTTRRLLRHNQLLQSAIAVQSAEQQVEAAERQQAREIQLGLLPKHIPQLPQFAITGAWEPAREVGGDYYDVIQLGNDKLAICIADVSGKGISAALLMANVQAAVRAFASNDMSPAQVCSQVNSVLCANTAPDKFVTLFYGVLDSNRVLRYTNAGHLRPVLIRAAGQVVHLENGGALLGVFPRWKYEDSVARIEPGDLLLLFTDGITEAATPQEEEFGEERLIAAVRQGTPLSIDELQSKIFREVRDFCQSRLADDATLLIVAARSGEDKRAAPVHKSDMKNILQYAGALS